MALRRDRRAGRRGCGRRDRALADVQTGVVEPCEAACYDCLLSYRNQSDHQLLDRALAIPVLARLRDGVLVASGPNTLEAAVDSPLEAAFLEFLRAGGHRLPDRAQVFFESAGTRPDYVYDEATGEWRPASEIAAEKARAAAVRDASGNVLADGDSVILIKDLKVKGAGQTLKRGTVIRSIRLTGNPEEIDCRHDAIKGLVLRPEFVRKR